MKGIRFFYFDSGKMYWRSLGCDRRALSVSDQNDVETTPLADEGDHYKLPFNLLAPEFYI
jgi:hypothetical protein